MGIKCMAQNITAGRRGLSHCSSLCELHSLGVLRASYSPSPLRDSTLSDPGLLTPGQLVLESALIPVSPEGLSSEPPHPLSRVGLSWTTTEEAGRREVLRLLRVQEDRGLSKGTAPCGLQPSLVSLTLRTTILNPAGWGITRGGSSLIWGIWGGAAAPDALQCL